MKAFRPCARASTSPHIQNTTFLLPTIDLKDIMKFKSTLIILALSAAPAFAFNADHGAKSKTRDEVKAELMQALRSGDIMAGGEIGAKVSDLNSGRYQLTTPALGKTRDQVRAELEQAVRSGDMFAAGESGSKLNELQPELYPAKAAQVGKTREEVKEELAEAIHTGDLMAAGEDGRKLNEIFPGHFHQHHAGSAAADSGHRNGQDL